MLITRWRLRRSTHIGGIATDHDATARAARSTLCALSELAASGAADASGANGEQPTLRHAFSERLASLAVQWTAALEDNRNAIMRTQGGARVR